MACRARTDRRDGSCKTTTATPACPRRSCHFPLAVGFRRTLFRCAIRQVFFSNPARLPQLQKQCIKVFCNGDRCAAQRMRVRLCVLHDDGNQHRGRLAVSEKNHGGMRRRHSIGQAGSVFRAAEILGVFTAPLLLYKKCCEIRWSRQRQLSSFTRCPSAIKFFVCSARAHTRFSRCSRARSTGLRRTKFGMSARVVS